MDINACSARPGRMCACRAVFGSDFRIFILALCVDLIVLPFGIHTEIPLVVGKMFEHMLVGNRKCPVVPVSAMACCEFDPYCVFAVWM